MLLKISDFNLSILDANNNILPILDNINFQVNYAEILGIAGESGSGKTLLGLSILGLIPQKIIYNISGQILFENKDLLKLNDYELMKIRGKEISMVFQEPMTALNPIMNVYNQLEEVLQTHFHNLSSSEIRDEIIKTLLKVGFDKPEDIINLYPHQLSGGMRQRLMLAISIIAKPKLIIADEPTTALDASLQLQLLSELKSLVTTHQISLIFISHDIGLINYISNKTLILYAGEMLEYGQTQKVFTNPFHPYTYSLKNSLPELSLETKLPRPIKGHLPKPSNKPKGCVFSPRCYKAQEICFDKKPQFREIINNHYVRCFYPENNYI